ncbi:MAG: gamma-glutamylcyclotransferase [Burkholderiales bacterium]|nr:gamma-glutamylcyclotransferase [Burkholderiales bacterium]
MIEQHASPQQIDDPVYQATLAGWDRSEDCWVFAYASLLWRPEFDAAEVRRARLWGWHRALEMRSRVNRGNPQQPGLVFALVGGGSCVGHVLRLPRDRAEQELQRLWHREMPGGGIYQPRWLRCDTGGGQVRALTFTLARDHPNYTGRLSDDQVRTILHTASGRYGSTLDYLLQTAEQLERLGIRDRKLERITALGRQVAAAIAAETR